MICSIARLPYVKQMANDADVTYTEAILGVWSIIEVNLGIICGCAMRLKPLIVRWFPNLGLFSSRNKSLGKSAGFGSWAASKELRTDPRNAQHTYKLHSIQKSSVDPVNESGNIRVDREYDITTEHERLSKRGSSFNSTEKINVPV